jgi:hypothetical protein
MTSGNVKEYVRRLYGLRGAFRRTFLTEAGTPHPDAAMVLGELRRFCHGGRPTIRGTDRLDPYASIAAAARQEVYFRIVGMLNLDDTDLALMERRAQHEDMTDA